MFKLWLFEDKKLEPCRVEDGIFGMERLIQTKIFIFYLESKYLLIPSTSWFVYVFCQFPLWFARIWHDYGYWSKLEEARPSPWIETLFIFLLTLSIQKILSPTHEQHLWSKIENPWHKNYMACQSIPSAFCSFISILVDIILYELSRGLMGWARSSSRLYSDSDPGIFAVTLRFASPISTYRIKMLTWIEKRIKLFLAIHQVE